MKLLTSFELLRLWEEELDQPLLNKSIRLLSETYAGGDSRSIGHLSIGDRDVRLLHLREWMFGKTLRNIAKCPECQETVEWESNTDELKLQAIAPELTVRTYSLERDGFWIRFRLPDSYDIMKVLSNSSYQDDQKKLIADCILEKKYNGKKIDGHDLPEEIWNALDDRMEKEDPQADIRVSLKCPACSHQWEASFDIIGFLWSEIQNWAHRVLQEVFLIARSFGWSEYDILNLSPNRRQLYIQMLSE